MRKNAPTETVYICGVGGEVSSYVLALPFKWNPETWLEEVNRSLSECCTPPKVRPAHLTFTFLCAAICGDQLLLGMWETLERRKGILRKWSLSSKNARWTEETKCNTELLMVLWSKKGWTK